MKLRNKKMVALVVAGTIVASTLSLGAAQLTKNVQVRYNNIKVQVDEQYKQPNLEPFFIGDSVYVSLRDAGELIGAKVGWQSVNQTVTIDTSTVGGGNAAEIQRLKQEIANKNLQLSVANEKVAKYEKELGITGGNGGGTTTKPDEDKIDVREIRNMLRDMYENEYSVAWSFGITGDAKGLDFTLQFDSSKDERDFYRIDESELEGFVEEMLLEIRKEHKGIPIKGVIYDKEEKIEVAEFDITSKGKYSFEFVEAESGDFTDKELKDMQTELKDKYTSLPSIPSNSYDFTSVRIKDIKLVEKSGDLVYEIHTSLPSFAKPAWNLLKADDLGKLDVWMEDIQKDIKEDLKEKANGYLLDANGKKVALYDSKLRLYKMD
ncbi:MAG: stalk domain-containing protein [Cellulosilyticaceae bacterium]